MYRFKFYSKCVKMNSLKCFISVRVKINNCVSWSKTVYIISALCIHVLRVARRRVLCCLLYKDSVLHSDIQFLKALKGSFQGTCPPYGKLKFKIKTITKANLNSRISVNKGCKKNQNASTNLPTAFIYSSKFLVSTKFHVPTAKSAMFNNNTHSLRFNNTHGLRFTSIIM